MAALVHDVYYTHPVPYVLVNISGVYHIGMEEITQGDNPLVPAGKGGTTPDELSYRAGAQQMDVATGLVRLSFLLQGIFALVSERHNLTPVQARLLCVVAENPRRMGDLANYFGVERAALTGLVDRAERRGLAERTSVPGDRRALHVAATEAGHQAARAFEADVAAELRSLASGLSAEDGEHFRRVLADIVSDHATPCQESASQGSQQLRPGGRPARRVARRRAQA